MKKNIIKIISLITFLLFQATPLNVLATLVGNTNNATLALSPESGLYRVSGTFQVEILVNTHGQNVNAVSAIITYNASLFGVTINSTGSLFSMEAESSVANGKIRIVRGSTTSVNTTSGRVAVLNITGLGNTVPSSDNLTFDFVAGDANQSNVFLTSDAAPVLSGVYNGRYSLDGTAPANVSNFTATASSGQISLSWVNPTTDFAGVTIIRKTGSYPTSVTDGTQIYDSNGTSYTNTGLTNGTVYYFKAFSRDIVLNYSGGAQVSATPNDVTPPATITNLSVTPLTARTIRLDWTAVGDDGSVGTATSYDARYSTAAITAANFTSASQISGAPSPGISGSAQTMTASGLSGNATYYFAIKAIDDSSNIGVISNIVSATTYRTADLNNNSYVNAQDFSILLSYWGSTARPAADINGDGYVNAQDFSIMLSQWD